MRMSGEFYLLHMFGGLRWMKMAGTVKADQFDLATSDKYIYVASSVFLVIFSPFEFISACI